MTDFGLSRFGQLGRQARAVHTGTSAGRRPGNSAQRSASASGRASGRSTPESQPRASYFNSLFLEDADNLSESSGSESVADRQKRSLQFGSAALSVDTQAGKSQQAGSRSRQSGTHRFVGTVDYVAPESILGVGVGEAVDWVRIAPSSRGAMTNRSLAVGARSHLPRIPHFVSSLPCWDTTRGV